MPNAKDAAKISHRILALGGTGNGKTAQFATFPGKKFAYLFDANAIGTLRGHDLEYAEFLPTPLSFDVQSLSEANKTKGKVMGTKGSDVYAAFERDWDARMTKGFFRDIDWLCIDSATTLLDMQMDTILTINGRPGTFPQKDDYGPQMVSFSNVVRTCIGMGIGLYITGHLHTDKDEHTQKIVQLPMMTGQLREKIPLLFTDVFKMTAIEDGRGNVKYLMETVPNQRETPIRTIIRGLLPKEDVTIDWEQPVVGQGLGGILVRDKEGVLQHVKAK